MKILLTYQSSIRRCFNRNGNEIVVAELATESYIIIFSSKHTISESKSYCVNLRIEFDLRSCLSKFTKARFISFIFRIFSDTTHVSYLLDHPV